MHPIKSIKAALTEARNLIVQLIYTVNHNSDVVAENSKVAAELLKSTQATQKAVTALLAIELHRNHEAGKRTDF